MMILMCIRPPPNVSLQACQQPNNGGEIQAGEVDELCPIFFYERKLGTLLFKVPSVHT